MCSAFGYTDIRYTVVYPKRLYIKMIKAIESGGFVSWTIPHATETPAKMDTFPIVVSCRCFSWAFHFDPCCGLNKKQLDSLASLGQYVGFNHAIFVRQIKHRPCFDGGSTNTACIQILFGLLRSKDFWWSLCYFHHPHRVHVQPHSKGKSRPA